MAARRSFAATQAKNYAEDCNRLVADEDCHGEDMLRLASLIGSGLVFTLVCEGKGGEPGRCAGGKEVLVHVMKAQGALIDSAMQRRIGWRRPAVKRAADLLNHAARILEECGP